MSDATDIKQAIDAGKYQVVSKECVATSAGVRVVGPGGSTPSYCGRERLAKLLGSYETDIQQATKMRDRTKAMLDAIDAEASKKPKG